MSQYTDFLRWQSGCRSFFSVDHGCTAGDSFHQGSRSYTEPFLCPNGLPIDTRAPQEVEWYRERVARARRDADLFDREKRMELVVWTDSDLNELALIAKGVYEH
jgi:hypothetical protein